MDYNTEAAFYAGPDNIRVECSEPDPINRYEVGFDDGRLTVIRFERNCGTVSDWDSLPPEVQAAIGNAVFSLCGEAARFHTMLRRLSPRIDMERVGELSADPDPNEECAQCGHPLSAHDLDPDEELPNCSLCGCNGFVSGPRTGD